MVSCSVAGEEYVRWPLKIAKKKNVFQIIFARLKFGGMTVGMMRNEKTIVSWPLSGGQVVRWVIKG